MLESTLLKQVRKLGVGTVRLFRNNVGALYDVRGQYVQYGLCTGSSDLIGYKSHTIRPEDVGRTIAIFVAIETKTHKGRVTEEQQRFIAAVQKAGGIAGVVRSQEQAALLLDSAP